MEISMFFLRHGIKDIPKEFGDFFCNTFELIQIRQRVGEEHEIIFEIRSKEGNHNVPHIHARYGKYKISIEIMNQEVLAGELPPKRQKYAQNWVKINKENLLGKWKDIHISTYSRNTISKLEQ